MELIMDLKKLKELYEIEWTTHYHHIIVGFSMQIFYEQN